MTDGFYLDPSIAGRSRTLEDCSFCELRRGDTRIGDDVACATCSRSRIARIAAVAKRRSRHADHAVDVVMTADDEHVDVFDEELGL